MNTNGQPEWKNIALLPNAEEAQQLCAISKQIHGSSLYLGTPYLPHLSVYQAMFANQTEEIRAAIERIIRQHPSFDLEITAFGTPGNGFIFADTNMPESLRSLHEELLRTVSPLRTPMAEVEIAKLNRPDWQKDNLRQYGMALCNDTYRPHFTVGLVEEGSVDATLEHLRHSVQLPITVTLQNLAILDCHPQNGAATKQL